MDKPNIVVYRYPNSLYLSDIEVYQKMTEYNTL